MDEQEVGRYWYIPDPIEDIFSWYGDRVEQAIDQVDDVAEGVSRGATSGGLIGLGLGITVVGAGAFFVFKVLK